MKFKRVTNDVVSDIVLTLAFISIMLISLVVSGAGPEYRIDYDYPNQGDDFCLGNRAQAGFKQGPELARTQDSRTAYAFIKPVAVIVCSTIQNHPLIWSLLMTSSNT